MSQRSRLVAVLLSVVGFLGLHRFYLGRFWTGLLMLLTLGGLGVWWLIDIYMLLSGKLTDSDMRHLAWFGARAVGEAPAQKSEELGADEKHGGGSAIGKQVAMNKIDEKGADMESNTTKNISNLDISDNIKRFCKIHEFYLDVDIGGFVCSKEFVFDAMDIRKSGMVEDLDEILEDPEDDWNAELITEVHNILMSKCFGDGDVYESSFSDEVNDGEWLLMFGELKKDGEKIRYRKMYIEPSGFEFNEIF